MEQAKMVLKKVLKTAVKALSTILFPVIVIFMIVVIFLAAATYFTVSYTHLDVYKRQ